MKKLQTDIKLEKNEKIELLITRSKLGLLLIWTCMTAGLVALTLITVSLPSIFRDISQQMIFQIDESAFGYLYIIIAMLYVVVIFTANVSAYVYKNNYLYVTNKRLIHRSTTALFAKSTNVIDLKSIEDVSFKQTGFVQYVFRLGTIRMSTVGDETTYCFDYVDTPTDELDAITHLIHVEKNKKTA